MDLEFYNGIHNVPIELEEKDLEPKKDEEAKPRLNWASCPIGKWDKIVSTKEE